MAYAKIKYIMIIFFLTFVFALVLDLISKNYFSIFRYLNFQYCNFDEVSLNINSAFGMGWGNTTMLVLSLGILVGILIWLFARYDWKNNLANVAFGLVVGGALGNIFDRVLFYGVRDFVSCFNYPTFNLADAFIVIGVALLLVFNFKSNEKNT